MRRADPAVHKHGDSDGDRLLNFSEAAAHGIQGFAARTEDAGLIRMKRNKQTNQAKNPQELVP